MECLEAFKYKIHMQPALSSILTKKYIPHTQTPLFPLFLTTQIAKENSLYFIE